MRVRVEIPDRSPARREADDRTSLALAELEQSPGRPLQEQVRREMEARFGCDFSEVRIHQDARADGSAQALGARAFTIGNHIFFRSGAFEPAKVDGRRLLAHELAHTLQQRPHPPVASAAPRLTPLLEPAAARLLEERRASDAAEAALSRRDSRSAAVARAARSAPHLARWVDSLPDDRAASSPANPFVEELALDVVHALQRDPDDTGAHSQRRLARLESATRAVVVARAQELLTPAERERCEKALTGAAVIGQERAPAAPPADKPAQPDAQHDRGGATPEQPESEVEKPVPAKATPVPPEPAGAAHGAPAGAATPVQRQPAGNLTALSERAKRPTAGPGARAVAAKAPLPAPKTPGEQPAAAAAGARVAEGAAPSAANRLGGRPAEAASPAAAAAQTDGGDAGAQPDLGPAAILEEKVEAKGRERQARADARAQGIEKKAADAAEGAVARPAASAAQPAAAPSEPAEHAEAIATLEAVSAVDAGGEPETPTTVPPAAAGLVAPVADAPPEPAAEAGPTADSEPGARAAETPPEPAAEPEPAAVSGSVARVAETPPERAAEPAPAAGIGPAADAEPPAGLESLTESGPGGETESTPEAGAPEPADAAQHALPAATVEPALAESATAVAPPGATPEAAPAVASEASSVVRDEAPAGEVPVPAIEGTEAPATERAASVVPATEGAPTGDATTEAQATEAPATEAPATEGAAAGAAEPGADEGPQAAPAGDGGDCGPDSAPGVGGGGGGGTTIPDRQPEPEPDVSQAAPEEAMATAATLAPGPLARTLGGVQAASQREMASKRDDLAANSPSIERPTGSPQNREGGDAHAARVAQAGGPGPEPAHADRSRSRAPTPKENPPALPPAPPSPTQAVNPPAVNTATQAQMTPQELQAFVSSFGRLPITDPGLNLTAGPPPTLALSGDADPDQVTEQRGKVDSAVGAAARDGAQTAAAPLGEHNIYPAVKPEILRAEPRVRGPVPSASTATPSAAAPGGAPAAAPGLAPRTPGAGAGPAAAAAGNPAGADPAEIIAKEQSTAEVQAAAADGQGQMVAGRQAQESGVDKANADAQAEIDKQVADNSKAQEDQRTQTLAQVGRERGAWTTEQEKALTKHGADADQQMQRVDTEVTARRERADKDAAAEIQKGNETAARERRKGEENAAAERKKGEEESRGGVLGWIADKARSFFNKIKAAIKAAFDWARQLVRDAINAAINLANKVIDAARDAIVSAIRSIGDALLKLGDELLGWFPALHDRYRKAIHGLVDAAVAKVDELADSLKEGVRKALNALAGAIDAVFAVYERALLAAVSFVQSAAEAAINKARAFVEMLAEWGQLIVDIASDPLRWLSNLGSSAIDGIKNHLWRAFKCAIKAWFRSKVEEVLGLPLTLFELLKRGGIKLAEIARMVWEGLKAAIPGILIQLAIEKIVAMIVPAAGAIMAIIEGLQAAWGTIQRIIAAFEKFFAFLKAVKLGNAGRQFAEMIAAAAIVVLDFLANFLIKRLMKPAKPIGGRLAEIGKKIMARLGTVARTVGRGLRRAGQAIKAAARKVAAVARKGAVVLKQAAQKAGRAIAKVAGRVGRAIKSGAGKVVAAVRKGAGRAMRVIERRFPRVARILKQGAALVGRARRWVGRKQQRAKAWLRHRRAHWRRGRQRRRERRRANAERRLQRAVAAIRPALEPMLARGAVPVYLTARLLLWRVRWRLSSLRIEGDGVVARINPDALVATVARISLASRLERVLEIAEEAFLSQLAIQQPEQITEVEEAVAQARAPRTEPYRELSSVQQMLFFRGIASEPGRFRGLRGMMRGFGRSQAAFVIKSRRRLAGWRVVYPPHARPTTPRITPGSYRDIAEHAGRYSRVLGVSPSAFMAAAAAPTATAREAAVDRLLASTPEAQRLAERPGLLRNIDSLNLLRSMEAARRPGQLGAQAISAATGGSYQQLLGRDPMQPYGSGVLADVEAGRADPRRFPPSVLTGAGRTRRARIVMIFRRLREMVRGGRALVAHGAEHSALEVIAKAFDNLLAGERADAGTEEMGTLERNLTIAVIRFLETYHGTDGGSE